MKRRSGFTLVEITMAISLLSVLTAVAIPQIERMAIKAREARLKSDLRTVREAIDRMAADTGRYPGTIDILRMTSAPTTGTWGPDSSPWNPSVVQAPLGGVDPAKWRGPYLNRDIVIDSYFSDYSIGMSPLGNVHTNGYIYDGGLSSGARHWFRVPSSRASTEGTAYNIW